ncbi:MAG: hypothetical protein HWD85_08695, partial [Flavobacteriaceae bacterium]|nr:hypothetical protein [Flavobacteriaceae bacterium]
MNFFKKLRVFKPVKVEMLVYYFPLIELNNTGLTVDGASLVKSGKEYRIENKGQLIHRSRIFFKSHFLTSFHFPQPFVVIGDCLTNPDYRGMGIYPKAIRYIASEYIQEKQVFILVSKDNFASIRGIEKAGFNFFVRLKGFRFLGLYFKKQIFCSKN